MSVKYNSKTIEFVPSVTNTALTAADRVAFMTHIMSVLSELSGVALEVSTSTANPSATNGAAAYITIKDSMSGNTIMQMQMPGTSSNDRGNVCFGPVYNISQTSFERTYSTYGSANVMSSASLLRLYMHYLKAGDLFVFGFAPYNKTAGYYGWINMALAPVRSFSDPTRIVGYTFVFVNHANHEDDSRQTAIMCGQFYDPAKEDEAEYSIAWEPFNSRYFTAYRSKSVALMPLMMGCADYYVDGVYIANKYGSRNTEMAVQMDIGTFLIANTYGTVSNIKYTNVLFDISVIAADVVTDDL